MVQDMVQEGPEGDRAFHCFLERVRSLADEEARELARAYDRLTIGTSGHSTVPALGDRQGRLAVQAATEAFAQVGYRIDPDHDVRDEWSMSAEHGAALNACCEAAISFFLTDQPEATRLRAPWKAVIRDCGDQ